MLPTSITALLATAEVDVTRVPSGSGIDLLVWPIMIAAFIYIVYATTKKNPTNKGNKDKEN